jgi:hypothetical protein
MVLTDSFTGTSKRSIIDLLFDTVGERALVW